MTGDERVVDVASLCSQPLHVQLNPGEPLGIFFPVHGWRPPMLLRRVLSEMTLSVGSERNVKPYVYSVCTVGDTVQVKVMEIDLDRRRISLSMKAAAETLGTEVEVKPLPESEKPAEAEEAAEAEAEETVEE